VGADDYRAVGRAGVVGHETLAEAAGESEKPPEPEGPSDFSTDKLAPRGPPVKSDAPGTPAAALLLADPVPRLEAHASIRSLEGQSPLR
jgi:hypothetical protein